MIRTCADGVDIDLLSDTPEEKRNPFRPGFGCPPLALVGRSDEINSFLNALKNGPGSEGSSYVITGARGTGKTVLVNEIANICRQAGFDVFSYSAKDGTVDDFVGDMRSFLSDCNKSDKYDVEISPDINIFGIGGSLGSIRKKAKDISSMRLDNLLSIVCSISKRGVIIVLDEVDPRFADDLVPIIKAYQSALANKMNIYMLVSGLPASIRRFEQLPGVTFLHRSKHGRLSSLSYEDSIYAIVDTCLSSGGIAIDNKHASIIAKASCGYPFAIQQLGSMSWNKAKRMGRATIARSDCDITIQSAYSIFSHQILDIVFRDMSITELKIVREAAMLADKSAIGNILVSDLRAALDFTPQYMGIYRNRLISDGIFTIVGTKKKGEVRFTFPYMTEYVVNNIELIDYAISTGKEHPLTDFIGNN